MYNKSFPNSRQWKLFTTKTQKDILKVEYHFFFFFWTRLRLINSRRTLWAFKLEHFNENKIKKKMACFFWKIRSRKRSRFSWSSLQKEDIFRFNFQIKLKLMCFSMSAELCRKLKFLKLREKGCSRNFWVIIWKNCD